MPTADTRHMNWTASFLVTGGGSPTVIKHVQGVNFAPNANFVKDSGDGDVGPTLIVNDYNDPEVRITTHDLLALQALPPGTRGALTATNLGAKNKTTVGGGGYKIVMANAIIMDTPFGGQHRQIGEGTINVGAEWADGVTNPVTFAAL